MTVNQSRGNVLRQQITGISLAWVLIAAEITRSQLLLRLPLLLEPPLPPVLKYRLLTTLYGSLHEGLKFEVCFVRAVLLIFIESFLVGEERLAHNDHSSRRGVRCSRHRFARRTSSSRPQGSVRPPPEQKLVGADQRRD